MITTKFIIFLIILYVDFCRCITLFNAHSIDTLENDYQKYGRTAVTLEFKFTNVFSEYTRTCSGIIMTKSEKIIEILTAISCIAPVKKKGLTLKLEELTVNYLSENLKTINYLFLPKKSFTLLTTDLLHDSFLNNDARTLTIKINQNKSKVTIPSSINSLISNNLVSSTLILDIFEYFKHTNDTISGLWCRQKKYAQLNEYYPVCKYYNDISELGLTADYNSKGNIIYYLSIISPIDSVSEVDIGGPLFLCYKLHVNHKLTCYLTGFYSFSEHLTQFINGHKTHYNKIFFTVLASDT